VGVYKIYKEAIVHGPLLDFAITLFELNSLIEMPGIHIQLSKTQSVQNGKDQFN